MPDWKININDGGTGGGAEFVPGLAGAKAGDPLEAMTDEVPHILLRVRHRRAVRRIVDAIVAAAELVEAAHVLGHVSVRWNHDGRGPAHHMIAAE